MKKQLAPLAIFTSKINQQNVQFILAVIVLAMLVLGIGAPTDGLGLTTH